MTTPAPTAAAPEAGDRRGAPYQLDGTRALAWLNIGLIGLQALALCFYLWPQWRQDPDLSHGLFMPLVFLLLLWEGRHSSPARHPAAGVWSLMVIVLLAAVALAGLTAAGLFAVSLGWSHSLVSFMLVAAFATALLAALVALSAAPLSLLPLNWITFVAILLWLLAAPMPPGTYLTLTSRLQSWVTGHVLTALNVLGVAARQRGNLIDLANTTVGVEEACSGIRSLLACIYAGFFFSALLVRRPWARTVLLVLAAPLAIGMNFVRSLTLTLLANAGVDIGGFWHDATGYSILAVTAIVLVGLAFMLEPRGRNPAPVPSPAAPAVGRASARLLLVSQAVLCACLLLASGVAAFFVSHTQKATREGRPPPDLTAVLPAAFDGWKVVTSADLYKFSDTLQTDDLVQRTYFKGTANDFTQITVYLAFWPAGQASVSSVSVHTPDACWPGVGWQAVPAAATRFTPVVGRQRLPVAESRLFTSGDFMQHVWFWHLYDGKPITQRDPRSPRELLSIAWRYGFRKDGDQLFVRISSNRPWDAMATEPLVAEIFTRLHAFGL